MMEQTNHSTDTLLASFQAGNMAAFSQLYNLHINVLFNYGLKLTIDKELLKDCIHDIFVKLYTKKDELGVDVSVPVLPERNTHPPEFPDDEPGHLPLLAGGGGDVVKSH